MIPLGKAQIQKAEPKPVKSESSCPVSAKSASAATFQWPQPPQLEALVFGGILGFRARPEAPEPRSVASAAERLAEQLSGRRSFTRRPADCDGEDTLPFRYASVDKPKLNSEKRTS